MPHYPGHQDEAPPSTTDWAATNPNYNARTRLPATPVTKYPPKTVRPKDYRRYVTTPYGASPLDRFTNARGEQYSWNPRSGIYEVSGKVLPPVTLDYLKALQYDVTPYGASPRQSFVRDGMSYRWNPQSKMYEVVGWSGTGDAAATGGGTTPPGGPGGPGKENPYEKINRKANQQRLAARTAYMNKLGSAEEQARLARVGAVEAPAALASNLAQRAIGGFGGISEAAKQYVGDVFRTQEGQQIASKAGAYADYLMSRLGIAREEAEAIALKAVEQADANAAKVMGEMRRRLEAIGQTVSSAVDMSKKAGERELAYVESLLGGK